MTPSCSTCPEFFDISRAFLESAGKARGLTKDGRLT